MYQKQRGASMWQMMFYVGLAFVVVYLALRLTPIYLEGMSVKKAFSQLQSNGASMTRQEVKSKVDSQFTVDSVKRVSSKDLEFKSLRSGKTEVSLDYDVKVPLVGNLTLVVEFRNRAEI